ncbi:MAG: conjugal transfer protein TraR [Ignavibacterium sp.]|nr:MAG: conjugal transfer protein TraR [Ignavibacterium sp.]
MAKKTTTKKKITKKGTKKTTVKGKAKVTKKKTTAKKAAKPAAKKKTAAKKPAVKKKATTKKTTAKKASVAKKKTTAPKPKTKKKTTAAKAPVKKVTKKTTKKAAVTKAAKKTEEVYKSPSQTRAEAIKKIKGYGKKDLQHFRNIILEKREEILEDLQSLKEQMLDPTTGEYINENSPYSLHMAEQGTDAMEREKTFLYAQRENKFLGYLDDALKRIETGTYGICIECIDVRHNLCETCPLVPKARLEAVPHTQHCLPIKQRKGGR